MKIIVSRSALKPSQYRPYVKGWDKNRYARAFHYYSGASAYRIYLPLVGDIEEIQIPKDIMKAVTDSGCEIADYVNGVATDSHGRKRRIGSVIEDPILRQRFANDPQRAASKEPMQVVISRHPYDIAGMSTGRGWTSCMNKDRGDYAHFIMDDVQQGTLIAYLVSTKDPDIKSPSARILLKPYIAKEQGWSGDRAALLPSMVYGTAPKAFMQTVNHWCADYNKRFNNIAVGEAVKLNKSLYKDNLDLYTKVPDLEDDNAIAPYLIKMVLDGAEGRAYHLADMHGKSMFENIPYKRNELLFLLDRVRNVSYPRSIYYLTFLSFYSKLPAFLKKEDAVSAFIDAYCSTLIELGKDQRKDKYLSFTQLLTVLPKRVFDEGIKNLSRYSLGHLSTLPEFRKYYENNHF
jgi:hypothetical protein